jgi:signal transduction histidine kinase
MATFLFDRFFSSIRPASSGATPHTHQTIAALWRPEKVILDTLDFNALVQKIVDSVLLELGHMKLGYSSVSLALVNHDEKQLVRVSMAQTEEYKKSLAGTADVFSDLHIPLSETQNICIKAINEGKSVMTHDWYDVLRPTFVIEEAHKKQIASGIKTSMVYPVIYHGKSEGVLIFSMIKEALEISDEEKDLIRSFTDVVGLAVQNSKLYMSVEQTTEKLRQTNDQLVKANDQMQELSKLKDEFVSMASHELRTPMTAIRGSLSTILEGYAGELSKESREFLVAAYNENDRLLRMVNNLLNISRIESGHFKFLYEHVNVNGLILEVVNGLTSAAKEKNIYLTYHQNTAVPMIMADGDKIKEVLINLIGNAVKFTHVGGVTVSLEQKEGSLTISIADTGSGIAKEDQELLFKKFSQIQGDYAKQTGGTGLGLYICKIIIEGLKGKIWLDSTLGKGSTFYFSLPIVS